MHTSLQLKKKYEDAIRKTISFIIQELSADGTGFYAAMDADSEGEEGKYYVWQKEEIDLVLGDDSAIFCAFFDITEQGNWEEKNILRNLKSTEDFIKERGLSEEQFLQIVNQGKQKLLLRRNSRIMPSLDDKIILGWNALMVRSVAKAAVVLQDDSYRKIAETNVDFIQRNFKKDEYTGELFHTYKNGNAKYPAFLDDYAYLIAALIQLYKATFNEKHLELANKYCDHVVENFSDQDDTFFFFTHFDQKNIIVRKKEIYDGATPSGNAVMAKNLYQLAIIFEKPDWSTRADKMLKTLSSSVIKYPGSFSIWASLLIQQFAQMNEIAIIGTDFVQVGNKILLKFIPNLVMMASSKENKRFALLRDKPGNESTLSYLCKNYTCLAPFMHPDILLEKIEKSNKIVT